MSCPFTLGGEQCQLPDPKHWQAHVTTGRIQFSDKASDQGQKKTA
jgi:hypothetical protein